MIDHFLKFGNSDTAIRIEVIIPENCSNAKNISQRVHCEENSDEILIPSYTGVIVKECNTNQRYLLLELVPNDLDFQKILKINKYVTMPSCLGKLFAIGVGLQNANLKLNALDYEKIICNFNNNTAHISQLVYEICKKIVENKELKEVLQKLNTNLSAFKVINYDSNEQRNVIKDKEKKRREEENRRREEEEKKRKAKEEEEEENRRREEEEKKRREENKTKQKEYTEKKEKIKAFKETSKIKKEYFATVE